MNFSTLIKKKLIIVALAVCLSVVIFIILHSTRTSSPISDEKFVEVYVQMFIASKMYDTNPSKLEEERKRIFQKYEVTQEEIDSFVKAYNKNPENWARIWEKIVRRLEEEKEKANSP